MTTLCKKLGMPNSVFHQAHGQLSRIRDYNYYSRSYSANPIWNWVTLPIWGNTKSYRGAENPIFFQHSWKKTRVLMSTILRGTFQLYWPPPLPMEKKRHWKLFMSVTKNPSSCLPFQRLQYHHGLSSIKRQLLCELEASLNLSGRSFSIAFVGK